MHINNTFVLKVGFDWDGTKFQGKFIFMYKI